MIQLKPMTKHTHSTKCFRIPQKRILTPLLIVLLFVQCKSEQISLEDMILFPEPVNIEGYWVQVKTEFTNPDGSTQQAEYKVGHYWMMNDDSIFEIVYPNYVSYATGYENTAEYGINCSNPTYNKILNAYFRGDTLILGGNNEANIEHEYFLIKSEINKDSIDDLVSKRVNWPAYYGRWEFMEACHERDMLDVIDQEEMNFKIPDSILINEKTVFNFDTLKYYDAYLEQQFSLKFTDPLKIHSAVLQLLFEYIPDEEDGVIILQYQAADSLW